MKKRSLWNIQCCNGTSDLHYEDKRSKRTYKIYRKILGYKTKATKKPPKIYACGVLQNIKPVFRDFISGSCFFWYSFYAMHMIIVQLDFFFVCCFSHRFDQYAGCGGHTWEVCEERDRPSVSHDLLFAFRFLL